MELTLNQKLHKERDAVLRFCASHSPIRLFGSGDPAILFYRYLCDEGIAIQDFLVADDDETASPWFDRPVVKLSEATFTKDEGIIVTSEMWMQGFVVYRLKELGVQPEQIYQQGVYAQYTDMERDLSAALSDYVGAGNPDGYFARFTALNEAGKRTGTDKTDETHNYLNKYEFFLHPWKDRDFTLLELGIFKGASLKMWHSYFTKARVVGVDFDESCAQYAEDRVEVVIADLSLNETLEDLKKYKPEIIIDDASHIWSHQIKAICALWDVLPHGGVYILEDLETSFSVYRFGNYDDATVSGYQFLQAVSTVVTSGERMDASALSRDLALLQNEIETIAAEVEMISFIHGSCILVKK